MRTFSYLTLAGSNSPTYKDYPQIATYELVGLICANLIHLLKLLVCSGELPIIQLEMFSCERRALGHEIVCLPVFAVQNLIGICRLKNAAHDQKLFNTFAGLKLRVITFQSKVVLASQSVNEVENLGDDFF